MDNKHDALTTENPEWILCMDQMPPKGKKIQMRRMGGNLFDGLWHEEYRVVAWRFLPKFTPGQQRRLLAAKAAGLDPTKLNGGF